MSKSLSIFLMLSAAAALFLTCSDTPRNNPFDPRSEVLIVDVVAPPAGRIYVTGHPITFEVAARTGYDNLPAGSAYLWKSDVSGVLSEERRFTTTLPAATHKIEVTVTDSLGRKGSQSLVLNVRSADEFGVELVVPSSDTALVTGKSFQPLAAEYVPEGSSVIGRLWDFGAGSGILQSTALNPGLVTFSQPGKFALSYQIVDQKGRVAADTVMVEIVEDGNPPSATIISPASSVALDVGDSVYFQADAVQGAATIVFQGWIYPDGSGLEHRADTLEVPGWRKLENPGIFTMIFRVGDQLGNVVEDSVRVTVNDTLSPPVGSIAAPSSDTSLVTGDSLYFRGQYTPEAHPGVYNLWNWGAGSGLAPDSVLEPGWKVFDSPGIFTVVYSALDASQRGTYDSLRVSVTANLPPVASITSPPADIAIGTGGSVNFNASDSDPEGRPLTRYWIWDEASGIPAAAADSASNAGARTFATNGTFQVVYVVVDDKGLSASDTVTVTVANNDPPTAQITAPSQDTTFWTYAPVQFAGTDSDPDGSVVSRQWDFGSSSVQTTGDTTRNATVTYVNSGNFTVKYTATDDKNATGADSLLVTVGANQQPQVDIFSPGGTNSISAGDSLVFIGSDQDPDGTIVSRLWDYGSGSGIAQDTVVIPDYRTFSNQGTFVVKYSVVDNHGGVNVDSVTVIVGP